MTFSGVPKYVVIDDFLSLELLAGLLEHALANEASFHPAEVMREGESQVIADARISTQSDLGLGPYKEDFKREILARFDHLIAGLGIRPFPVGWAEMQLIAHGDKAFYKAHIDTHTQAPYAGQTSDRVLSATFYFHREPKGFTGGEIAIHPFDKGGPPELIEPRQNRLVAFPSFAWHEVRPVSCPSNAFADSRFAVNCWLHRDRNTAKPDE